jgi:hypothetical protein
MRRVYKPARFRNEPGFHADREQRLIADWKAPASSCPIVATRSWPNFRPFLDSATYFSNMNTVFSMRYECE